MEYIRANENCFNDCTIRFLSTRRKNLAPNKWHREHQFVYVKSDQLKAAGRVPGGVVI